MPMYRKKEGISRHRLESLEAQREPIAIRTVLETAWQVDGSAVQPLQGLKHRAVVLPKQSLGHMQSIVRVDADQMSVERGVMNLRKRNAVRNDRLAETLILVRDDVRGIQQQRFRQSRQRAAAVVGG